MKRKIVQTENLDTLSKSGQCEQDYDGKKPNGKKKKQRKHDSKEMAVETAKEIENANGAVEKSIDENHTSEEAIDSDHEDTEKQEITKEESDRFSGKFLRNSFNSADGCAVLSKFVVLCDQNHEKDLVAEYLEAGGSVLEILRLLDCSEKRSINNIATVFTAMHLVIFKILAKYPHNQSRAEEACRHLINSHLAAIHSMLSSQSKSKHRKVVLKLLAAIVSLGGTLPRELLNHLSLHPQLVQVLTLHSKPTDPQNVRTCFIHFILAFLVEGNASNIRALLDKRAVFSGIFSGLTYDHSDVVQLVLATIKKYVLENPIVSKTTKLHVFSTPVVKDIIALYDWKGPKNWQKYKKQNTVQEHVSPEQKEMVVNILHEFLITLLTSTRHGVAFHDRSLGTEFGSKHNQLINTVLQSLDKPWEHIMISDLVIKITSACPDLIKPQLIYTEPFLVPRVSKNWIDVIQFVKKIIHNIDMESCLNLCSIDMSLQQLTNAMLSLILPPIVVKKAIIPSMEHGNVLIHYEIIDVLSTVLKKMKSLLERFKQSKHNKSEYGPFKNVVFEYISKHMPTFESILNIWNSAISVASNTEIIADDDLLHSHVNIKDHLMMVLNLLQAYSENFPEILFVEHLTNVNYQPVKLLTNLDEMENISKEELTVMKVKALKILMTLNISDFAPNEKLFSSALSFLLSKVGMNHVSLDSEILETIYLLLNKCDIFEEYNDEIEIWINAITYFESIDDKLEIANWITKLVTRVSKHNKKFMSMMYKNVENTDKEIFKTKSQEDIFEALSEKNIQDVKFVVPMLPASSMSLLVYGAVENYRKNPSETTSHYLSFTLTCILHCQVSPKALISLTEELSILSQNYISSWKECQPSTFPKNLSVTNNIFSTFSQLLLNCDAYKVGVAETKLFIQFDNSANQYQLTNFEVKALFRMVIFYLVQLSQENCTDCHRIATYTDILLVLLKIAIESLPKDTTKDCIKYIFQHPILLQYFQPIFTDSKSTQFYITKLIIQVLEAFDKTEFLTPEILDSYKIKLVTEVKSLIHKQKDNKMELDLKVHVELIGLLQMNKSTLVDLMTNIIVLNKEKFIVTDKRELAIWGIMIPELIKQFTLNIVKSESKSIITLDPKLLHKLIIFAISLKNHCKKEVTAWESSLFDYLCILPHSISIIDGNMFMAFLKSEITPATENILKLLVERNPKFVTILIKHANNNKDILQHKSLVFSIFSHDSKNKYDENFSRNVFEFYKTYITKYLIEGDDEQSSWVPKHMNAVSYLIQKYFDPKLCQGIVNTILSNEKKLDTVCEEHITLLFSIFKKHSELESNSLKNFVQILLHVTVIVLKKDSKNHSKLNFLCQMLINSIEILKIEKEFSYDELVKYNSWPQFTRITLKSGLKMTKDNKNEIKLLRALVISCEAAYRNNGNDEYVKTIFEMTTSHSEFINIMLSNTEIKSDVIKLLYILIQKNHSLMSTSHIPLYLASYNATLAESDQLIFKLLQYYENNGIKLNEFRPYLWGNAAAMHYSVKGETDTALWRQPSTSQVLDLFIAQNVADTIREYPTHRNWENDFSSTQTGNHVYDPAFYLPVLNQLLKDNNVVACHKVIHSGALSLIIMACTSSCQKIRLKAFDTISKFAFHLEATRSKEKPLWANFIDALHNGIKDMEVSIENVQLNGFVATFLARTCLIITQPLNPLYSPLHAFLMAKPALNLRTIPELLQLYHSSEIHHQIHRHWILEVIRDGLKTNNDVDVALKCVLFKMLLDFYFSSIADKTTKDLVLQVVKSASALTKLCTILVNGYSLLPWLINITKNLKKGNSVASSHVIEIVNNVNNVFKETKSQDTHHNLMLIKVLLSLKNSFNQNLPEKSFTSFINLLNQIIINRAVCKALPRNDLKSLIDFSKFFIEDVSEYELMLQFGCEFASNHVLDEAVSLKPALRKLLIKWFTYTI